MMVEQWQLEGVELYFMHFQTKHSLFFILALSYKEQSVENVLLGYEIVQFINKGFAFDVQTVNHHNQQLEIIRVILTEISFTIAFVSNYTIHYILNEIEVELLNEAFLVSEELGVDSELAKLDAVLVEEQNRKEVLNRSFVFATLFDETEEKLKTGLKNFL